MTLKRRIRDVLLLPFLIAAALSLLLAFLLRFEFSLPPVEERRLLTALCIFVPIKGIVFYAFGLHRTAWRVVSIFDLLSVTAANVVGSTGACILSLALIGPGLPRSVYIIDWLICFLICAGFEFSVRLYSELLGTRLKRPDRRKRLLIYGAGAAGLTLAKEIRSNPGLATEVLGFLDDQPSKWNRLIHGIPVLGAGRDAARIINRAQRRGKPVSEIVIAMPSASGKRMRAAIANCRAAGVRFRTVPSLGEMLNGKVLSSQIRDVSVNDLLGREPVSIDETMIGATVAGQNVLVTGGCGSIGSELCRQLARFDPGKLVIFDQSESELFMLMLELRNRYPGVHLVAELGDITKEARVVEVMEQHEIDVVFHAAAYKHVPMMEANVIEAVENNVVGTYNVAKAAYEQNVKRFVLISSDKAVNPSSIMGVTKRVAEMIVSAMPLKGGPSTTAFVSVRFGNVLASAGSVVQIFQRQIATGGPVTVTDPGMCRYFMSISEAVQLVLQASAMGKGSEVFVLDMGEPVRIVDLAMNMIRLAGLVPEEDIEIRYTGLRPGEKLFEELRLAGEDIVPTYHDKIKIFRGAAPLPTALHHWLETMRFLLQERDSEEVKSYLVSLVPNYQGHAAPVVDAPAADAPAAVMGANS